MIATGVRNIIIGTMITTQCGIFGTSANITYRLVDKNNYKNVNHELKIKDNLADIKFKQFKQTCAETKSIREYEIKRQQELQKQRNKSIKYNSLSRGSKVEELNLVCTFYTASADEGSGTGLTASGKLIRRGMIAANSFKFGTQIYTKEYGVLTVEDRGNPAYIHQIDSNTYRIDIYVENKTEANKLGVQRIKGKIIKQE